MAAASGKDSAKKYVKFTGKPSPKFFWWDTRTDKERNRKRIKPETGHKERQKEPVV